ncbi:MAG: UPF0175 family protein [Nitrospirota bacterium]
MIIVIPDTILHATRLTEDELKQEFAVALFQRERLTLGQDSILAGMNRLPFQRRECVQVRMRQEQGGEVLVHEAAGDR